MHQAALIGLVDHRGWLLMQERDENAPVDPEKWGLLGGGGEPHEAPLDAAVRELAEESVLTDHDLQLFGTHVLPCASGGKQDHVSLFGAQTSATDADIRCGEGRQIVFVAPDAIQHLDLSHLARNLYPAVLAIRDVPSFAPTWRSSRALSGASGTHRTPPLTFGEHSPMRDSDG